MDSRQIFLQKSANVPMMPPYIDLQKFTMELVNYLTDKIVTDCYLKINTP